MKKLKVKLRKNISGDLLMGTVGYLEGFSHSGPYVSVVLVYFPHINTLEQMSADSIIPIGYEEI